MTLRTTRRLVTLVGAAGLILTAGCTAGSSTLPRATTTVASGSLTLMGFSSCEDLLSGLRAAAKASVGPYGLPGGIEYAAGAVSGGVAAPRAAAPGADVAGGADNTSTPAYSTTNTAEPGVDEPDLVKTDGHRIVTVGDGVLRVVDAASRTLTGTLTVDRNGGAANLLLAGDRALVLLPSGGLDDIAGPRLLLVDLAGTPRVLSTYAMDGTLLDARQLGSMVRVVIRSYPRLMFPQLPNATAAARLAANRAAIDEAGPDAWLPRYEVDNGGTRSRGRTACDAVSRPADYSGAAMLTVVSFDLRRNTLGDGMPVTVVADGSQVYATGTSLYVINDNRWRVPPVPVLMPGGGQPVRPSPPPRRTEVYQFDTAGTGQPRYLAAGSVPGYVLNQYALSDWQGDLRVASTDGDASAVYVLHRDGAALRQVGKVGGLGKGQRIYSVRFDGPLGYVVTFRQTDPLYVLDLHDRAHPAVVGSLELTGYSAYLHPMGGGRLIGLGQQASTAGRIQGTQVSLFDVSHPAAPHLLARTEVRYGRSAAEFDPHAFLFWPSTGLLVIPMMTRGVVPVPDTAGGPVSGAVPQPVGALTAGAVALRLTDTTITPLGTISHDNQPILRSLVVDQTLWTVSATGLAGYDLTSLSPQAWLPD